MGTPERLPNPLAPEETDETLLRASVPYGYLRQQMIKPLTQRRFSDMISFLDLYGLVNARMVSKGRYGNTREITGSLPNQVVERFLKKYLK